MKFRAVLIAATILFSQLSHAGTTTAKIQRIFIAGDQELVYVYPVGGVVGGPACHGSNGSYYSFSINASKRPHSKLYYATLLAAKSQDKLVTMVGYAACLDQTVSETLMSIDFK